VLNRYWEADRWSGRLEGSGRQQGLILSLSTGECDCSSTIHGTSRAMSMKIECWTAGEDLVLIVECRVLELSPRNQCAACSRTIWPCSTACHLQGLVEPGDQVPARSQLSYDEGRAEDFQGDLEFPFKRIQIHLRDRRRSFDQAVSMISALPVMNISRSLVVCLTFSNSEVPTALSSSFERRAIVP
jgi:hypothetical protein